MIFPKKGIYVAFILTGLVLAAFPLILRVFTGDEQSIVAFNKAKRILNEQIWHDSRKTIYCGAAYDASGHINLPPGFKTSAHHSRSERMEWEHAVPVENFGRSFKEWREGDAACVSKGKAYKGRKCASKVNSEFREMEADMYNLFPSIGSVNAVRSNRQYAELPDAEEDFGICKARVAGKFFEPPDSAKGQVARAALYMDAQYSRFKLSRKQKRLFIAWNNKFPPDAAECERGRRIQRLQKRENKFISRACARVGL